MNPLKAELVADLKAEMKDAVDRDDYARIGQLSNYIKFLLHGDEAKGEPEPKIVDKKLAAKNTPAKRVHHPVGARLSVGYKKTLYTIEVVPAGYSMAGNVYKTIGAVIDAIAGPDNARHLRQLSAWKVEG